MSLSPGTRLAHYEILELIGKGGMGEVYRAKDSKLGREVAVKVLPDAFAQDADRLARFQREAKVLASLNHPNIGAIYGLEQSGTTLYLVLELVPGETLAERIARGPIPVDEALEIAKKIADALQEAHAQGVVHRDLKPANTKLAPGDKVKVLDFGLAKAFGEEMPDGDNDNSLSPTMTRNATRAGVLLGTAAYMSPEQARGKAVDKRTDIWAFGCVLYEMLTAKRLFDGETVSDTLAAVLKTDPDWSSLPPLPGPVRRVLKRCLEREPNRRLHDIADARLELMDAAEGDAETETPAVLSSQGRGGTLRALLWAGSVLGALAFGALLGGNDRGRPPEVVKFLLPVAETGDASEPAIAPDGRAVAYRQGNRLWLQALKDWEAFAIPGTEGADFAFWSPDGAWLGYVKDQFLWKVPRQGGAAQAICEVPGGVTEAARGGGASWGRDGFILFSGPHGAIYEVSDRGGDPRIAYEPDAASDALDFHNPHAFSPLSKDKSVLTVVHTSAGVDTLAVISQQGRRAILSAPGQRLARPAYSSTGHVVYQRTGSNAGIWAVPFDPAEGDVTGEPFLVAPGGRQPSLSEDGTLVFLMGDEPEAWQFVWVDRDGKPSEPFGAPRPYGDEFFLSPEGTRLAVSIRDGPVESIWIQDLRTGNETRLTYDGMDEVESWFAASDRILYRRLHPGTGEWEVFAKAANGSGGDVPMVRNARGTQISRDGRYLVFDRPNLGAKFQRTLWVDDLEDAEEARPFPASHAGARFPQLSPDNRWVSYTAAGTSANEIYVTRFPSGEGRWQVSSEGGTWGGWSPLGDEIFYLAPGGDLMAVSFVASQDALTFGAPRRLFNLGRKRPGYRVAPDGARFLFTTLVGELEPAEIRVIQNWTSELRKR